MYKLFPSISDLIKADFFIHVKQIFILQVNRIIKPYTYCSILWASVLKAVHIFTHFILIRVL